VDPSTQHGGATAEDLRRGETLEVARERCAAAYNTMIAMQMLDAIEPSSKVQPDTFQLSASLRNCLERISRGPSEQLGPRPDGMSFAILAGMLEKRGLVRTIEHRNHTRTYGLTSDGKACLVKMRQHKIGEASCE
jgi:hypothetical protein